MSDAPASTRDTVFLAVTRPATFYGVPVQGFVLAAGAAGWLFNVTHAYNLFWRAGLCGGAALLVLGIMRALTSWEPNWWHILGSWARTTGRVRFARPTRAWGGSTANPTPARLRHDRREMRDYAG